MPVPARPFLLALSGWLVMGIGASLWPVVLPWWMGAGILLGSVAVLDAIVLCREKRITITREVPGRMALAVTHEVPLTLHFAGEHEARVRVWDTLPAALESTDFPWSGTIPGGGYTTVALRLQPVERGPVVFGQVHVEQYSRLGFWSLRYQTGTPAVTRVYPNYEPVVRFALLSMLNNQATMGIRQINRPGQSREFRQLRDYQDGDAMGQIDWKATSRRLTLTSREYEEQRNQTLILMVDCGRRLRTMDGDLTQFDHSLNALLLLSFIALRQGDHVGVMSFGSDTPRWLPPVKGPHAMPAILNHLYDYQQGTSPGDFSEAAEGLQARWSRRALVVIATNLRSEDESHFTAPLALMRKKHLVVVASLREKEVAAMEHTPVHDLATAVRFGAIQHYLDERRQLLEKLHRGGIMTVDAPAADLPMALGNLYIGIKKRGVL